MEVSSLFCSIYAFCCILLQSSFDQNSFWMTHHVIGNFYVVVCNDENRIIIKTESLTGQEAITNDHFQLALLHSSKSDIVIIYRLQQTRNQDLFEVCCPDEVGIYALGLVNKFYRRFACQQGNRERMLSVVRGITTDFI